MALRLTQLRYAGYHHGNRLGYLGYGYKRHVDEVAPTDMRAFRDLKLHEVSGWLANQDVSINGAFFAVRRRYLAWRWKYSMPIEINPDGEIGGYGVNKWAPSGTALIQAWLMAFFAMYLFTWDEAQHHRVKKYHW